MLSLDLYEDVLQPLQFATALSLTPLSFISLEELNYTPPPLSSTGMTLLSDLRVFFDSGGAAAKSLSVAHTYRTKVS